MTNPLYNVNIVYKPKEPNGWLGSSSVVNYTADYFVASMPEIGLSGTGSSYTASLASLLAVVASASGYFPTPLCLM